MFCAVAACWCKLLQLLYAFCTACCGHPLQCPSSFLPGPPEKKKKWTRESRHTLGAARACGPDAVKHGQLLRAGWRWQGAGVVPVHVLYYGLCRRVRLIRHDIPGPSNGAEGVDRGEARDA